MSVWDEAVVLWSGGCDSTLVLHEAATDGAESFRFPNGGSIERVRAISIESKRLGANTEQIEARKRIRAQFDKQGLRIKYETICFDCDWLNGPGADVGGSNQTALWLTLAIQCLRPKDDLLLGFVDGEMDNIERVRAAFDALQIVAGKTGKLRVPLYERNQRSKEHVIERMRELRLYDLCWWCQDPKDGKACRGRRCIPCMKDAQARWTIEQPFWKPLNKALSFK